MNRTALCPIRLAELYVLLTFVPLEVCGQPSVVRPGQETRTRLPFTYVLDGGPGRLSDEDFVRAVGLGAPLLQHMQSGSCVHSYWGDFGARERARQRAAGKTAPAPNYAQMYRERMARYQKLIAEMRRVGSKTIVSYICIMTVGGDPEKRTGYWEFYDHWDEMRELGIGPKPPADPVEWGQRRADGTPKYFYRHDHPPYRPMFRYAQCLNNPYWQQYVKWITRMNARCGYDGNFVDNANSHRCHCMICQRLYRDYLRQKYSPGEIRELFGPAPKLSEDPNALAGAESRRFWAQTVRKFLAMIRQAGADVRGSWYVYPNGLHRRPFSAVMSFTDCDLAMDENSVGEFGTHPGMTFQEVIAGIGVRHVNDNIFCHRHTFAANGRVRSALLTRPGYPRADPAFMMNRDVGALGLAEAAAFSGGGAFLHRPATRSPDLAEVRNTFNKFFPAHRAFYEGFVPYGRIALACFGEQQMYNDRGHLARAGLLLSALMRKRLLVDVFTERNWREDLLVYYEALVIPDLKYMSDAEVKTALDFARRGRLIVTGDSAKFDLQMRPRKQQVFSRFIVPGKTSDVLDVLKDARLWMPVLPAGPERALLRIAAYADRRDNPTRIVLHLVNYAVPLGRDAKPAEPIDSVRVTLPLPAGARARGVTLARPGKADVRLAVKMKNGAVEFTVPTMRIYAVCLIELAT